MNDQELERRLEQALSHSAPDDPEGVLSRCETRKGNVTPMKQKRPAVRRWAVAACLALFLIGGGGGLVYHQAYAVASVVSLDVNPSIELRVNRNEKVLTCTPLNEDAAVVLADMDGGADLKGTKLDVAVNAIVGSLVRYGYLDDISSAILISVEDQNQDRAARLQQELTEAVGATLQEQSANAAILSQTVTQEPELETQARENNISVGKAYLVRQVLEQNGIDAGETEALSALSVEELEDLLKTGERRVPIGKSAAAAAAEAYAGTLDIDSVTTEVDPELDETPACYEVKLRHPTLGKFEYTVDAWTGEVLSGQADILDNIQAAPSGTLIGEAEAKSAALAHAGVAADAVKYCNAWVEYHDGRPDHYEVEFEAGGVQYKYEIGLYDGAVLKDRQEDHGHSTGSSGSTSSGTTPSGTLIGEAEAKSAALAHAGITADAVKYCNAWLEYHDGRPDHYEVEFETGGVQYKYEIGLYDGAVLKNEQEDHHHDPDGEDSGSGTDIGETGAKNAALAHAGLTESQVSKLKAHWENEDGRLVYEVEFETADAEYEYKIDGSTGAVLKYEQEDRHHDSERDGSASGTDIGEDGAKSAALDHAGLTESQTTKLKAHREDEDGRLVYEVEIETADAEYEYKIDGSTGAVLEYEQEEHHQDSGRGSSASGTDIGETEAKSAALDHAGLTESQTTKLKAHREDEDGRLVYEVEFETADTEYEYKIDGSTGAVLKAEREDHHRG